MERKVRITSRFYNGSFPTANCQITTAPQCVIPTIARVDKIMKLRNRTMETIVHCGAMTTYMKKKKRGLDSRQCEIIKERAGCSEAVSNMTGGTSRFRETKPPSCSELVLLMEDSELAFKSCDYLQCNVMTTI